MNTQLDWTAIRTFLSVVEHGSFSAAARELGLSQPTVGRHIAMLEDQFSAPLFERSQRGHILTPKARDILPYAERMRDAMGDMSVQAASGPMMGTVRITASDFVASYVLPPVIADLRRDLPDIAIEIVATDETENLMQRHADIALRMYRPTQLDTITRKLGALPIGVLAHKSYIARRGRPQSGPDLVNHDLIGDDRNERIVNAMNARGIPAKRDWFSVRCDDASVYVQLIRAGCGIGFSPRILLDLDSDLIDLFPDMPMPEMQLWLAAHDVIYKTPAVRAVWDRLILGLGPMIS